MNGKMRVAKIDVVIGMLFVVMSWTLTLLYAITVQFSVTAILQTALFFLISAFTTWVAAAVIACNR